MYLEGYSLVIFNAEVNCVSQCHTKVRNKSTL